MCRADERSVIRRMQALHTADNGLRPHPPYRTVAGGFPSRPFAPFADKDFSHLHFPLNARTGSSRAARAAGSRLATMPVIKAVAMPATLAQVGGQAGRVG